jgi:hydroxyacyl-ACP dehydratase HTD2-like protein with hotdog domain
LHFPGIVVPVPFSVTPLQHCFFVGIGAMAAFDAFDFATLRQPLTGDMPVCCASEFEVKALRAV